MRPYTIKIPAGTSYEVPCNGDYIRIADATVPITIESPDRSEQVTLNEGDDARLSAFVRLRFSHGDASEQTVTVYIGRGTQISSSRVGGTLTVGPSQTGGAAVHSDKTVGLASAQLVAANSARKFILIQNKSAAGTVWLNINGDAATAGNGIKLGPGELFELNGIWISTAQINAIGDIANNTQVLVVEGQ